MRTLRIVLALAFGVGALGVVAMADPAKALSEKASDSDIVVTAQDRGFTNDKLYLRLDDDKEITLIVDIPGDKDRKWQKDYAMNSRVTVTYHKNAEGKLVATSIKAAAPSK